jgi:hypothetical protein
MQLTSPPVTSLGMSLWCAAAHPYDLPISAPTHLPTSARFNKRNAQGDQLLPSTANVLTGVTSGHLADMLGAQQRELEYRWTMLHDASSWVRSADAVVLPNEDVDVEHSEGYRGVYVNPSNGIAFPGGFWKGLKGAVLRRFEAGWAVVSMTPGRPIQQHALRYTLVSFT